MTYIMKHRNNTRTSQDREKNAYVEYNSPFFSTVRNREIGTGIS